jgi:hypothetical protein
VIDGTIIHYITIDQNAWERQLLVYDLKMHANMVLQNTVAFRKELDEVRASHIKEYPSTTLAAETLVLGDISQAH